MAVQIHSYYFSWQKRFFDLGFSLLFLVPLFPIFIVIAVSVWLGSGWPVFFVQKRVGRNGKVFRIYKFRTMYVGADRHQKKFQKLNQAPGPMFKIFEDPRFVGIGRWLSRTGFDELPQVFNIIKGEMSFVGPRPLPVKEDKQLSDVWAFRRKVQPGVFSKWTLADNRHDSLTDWKNLDSQTLENGSISSDLQMIYLTLKKVLVKLMFSFFKK